MGQNLRRGVVSQNLAAIAIGVEIVRQVIIHQLFTEQLHRTWRDLEDFYWNEVHDVRVGHHETEQLSRRQTDILDAVTRQLANGESLTPMEDNGVLHALQLLIEYSIGKAKYMLKLHERLPDVSAYDSFTELVRINVIQGS